MSMRLALTMMLLWIGCDDRSANAPTTAPRRAQPPAPPPPPPPPDAQVVDSDEIAAELERNIPVLSITLAQLAADYRQNEVAADDKYKDQVVQFTAAVHRIAKDNSGRPFLELQVGTAHTFVHALFASEDGLAALKRGQSVTVHCFCQGFVGQRLALNSCALQ